MPYYASLKAPFSRPRDLRSRQFRGCPDAAGAGGRCRGAVAGAAAAAGLEIAEERLEDSWAPLDETVATEELEEMIHSKEAHTNAVNLESVSPDSKSMSSSYTLLVVVFTN
ncbi:hypothetical protein PVAP13_8NG256900 [Panicum virgatum]|uniref:Uncharacterized protein n=1 Tax=Panicum virgatum TaxID=38727 RepID=A0A8T0PGL0_PANVG|nr:hypothetical protein PVAP13_8NG256900 [Panicum virgatum]